MTVTTLKHLQERESAGQLLRAMARPSITLVQLQFHSDRASGGCRPSRHVTVLMRWHDVISLWLCSSLPNGTLHFIHLIISIRVGIE